MKEQKNNNIGMKVLSVFIAAIIWLLVANTNDPVVTKKFADIQVSITNEDALTKLGYAYEVVDGSEVSITVKGKSSVVGGMTPSDFQAVADFSKLSEVDAVPIDVTAKKYADQLEIAVGTTNTMKIKKDEIVSISVPVNVVVDGEVADGYAVGSMTGTPNLVKVSGPENLLSNAKEIRAEVDIDGISHDVTTTAKPVLYDKEGKQIDTGQVEFDTTAIGVSIQLWKTKVVSIQLESTGEPADGYELTSFDYEPKKITVAAPADILKDLTSITLASISLEGLTKDYEEDIDLTQELLPENVILADDIEDIKVKANVEKIISKKITFSQKDLTVKNGSGYKIAYSDTNEYTITVDGVESVVNKLEIKQFAPWINLEGLESGAHELAIHVKDVEGITVDSTGKIQVTLS